MKKTGYLTFGAVMSALAVVTMLVSYFPTLTYAVPAMAGMFIMVVVIELGVKWAIISYFAAAVLSLLIAEPEAALFFVFLFGHYPIIKVALEKVKPKAVGFILKLLVFNAATVSVYYVLTEALGISMFEAEVGRYLVLAVLVLANVVFVVYDFAILRVSQWYMIKFHSRISRMIKR